MKIAYNIFIAISLSLYCISPIISQNKHDFIWPLGQGKYWHGLHPSGFPITFGGQIMNLNTEPLSLSLQDFPLKEVQAAINDQNGKLVAFTDGCRISDRTFKLMANSTSLNAGIIYNEYCGTPTSPITSYPVYQGNMFLPDPADTNAYYLFHLFMKDYNEVSELRYTKISKTATDTIESVSAINQLLFEDSNISKYVTATRHANGRDWWIVTPNYNTNRYHISLLSTTGVQDVWQQHIGVSADSVGEWGGQTVFSPDGRWYIKAIPEHGMHIFNFDRCNGRLFDSVFISFDTFTTTLTGVAISPNNRFLYLTAGHSVYQFDLEATHIANSRQTIAIYDGFQSPFVTGFYQAMLGPDGRIYIATPNQNNILHVIHFPDRFGTGCQMEQHGLDLLSINRLYLPNFPHYRLGPLDDSACDTLGLDNVPVANFRHDFEDSTDNLLVTFTSLAYGEPDTWSWTFGDGTTAVPDTSPVHAYAAPGIYTVCQWVSNGYGTDSICKPVEVGMTTGTIDAPTERDRRLKSPLRVWPNPARDRFTALTGAPAGLRQHGTLRNALGQVVARRAWLGDSAAWDVPGLPPGWYALEVEGDDGRRETARVLIGF